MIKQAFPDYPLSALPPIPPHWVDTSWHCDGCPSYMVAGLQVYVDHPDDAARDIPGGTRFVVVDQDSDVTLVESDDWSAVIEAVDDWIAAGIDAEAARSRA